MGKATTTVEEKPAVVEVVWRQMSVKDIDSVSRVAEETHPNLPESDQIFTERAKLFPEGCLALVESHSDRLHGYVISHPIRCRQIPALDSLLREISFEADQYYIHDLVILPRFRGYGLAKECMDKLFAIAKRYSTTCLISVYGTASFWGRFDFVPVEVDDGLKEKLLDYGDDATYLERRNM